MKTSGAGKAGAFILAAGAMAVGITGCAAGTDNAAHPATEKAAAGVAVNDAAAAVPAKTSVPAPAASTSAAGHAGGAGAGTDAAAAAKPAAAAPSTTSAAAAGNAAGSDTAAGVNAVAPAAAPAAAPATSPASLPPTIDTNPKRKTPSPAQAPPPSRTPDWSKVPHGSNTPGPLDPRCLTGRTLCIDMDTDTLMWMIDGVPQYGMDVRFGAASTPTRKGEFAIFSKIKDCVSNLYGSPMPDAMFFSGGEAVHFSIDFKTYGYEHRSHGCVNVRDRAALDKLFADTRIGDKVVVYGG